jgi:universal stress protein F
MLSGSAGAEVRMKRILVGLDGSPREQGVMAAALGLARRTGAELVLFRAVGLPTELPPDAYRLPPAEVTHLLEKQASDALARLRAEIPSDVASRNRVAIGTPWEAICRIAKDEDVDLVVVGSHRYDVLDRVLGTTAAKVVNHADRSVLVVRASERLA